MKLRMLVLCASKTLVPRMRSFRAFVPFWQGLDYLILPLQKGVGFHFKFHSSKRDSESSRIIYESVLCYSILQHNISYHSYASYGIHTYSTFIF